MAHIGRPPSEAYLTGRREQEIYGIAEYTLKAWNMHRQHAKRRGIPFRFGLFAWDQWWRRELIALGPAAKRGNRKGQYMMARIGDAGAYEHGNVHAVTAGPNQLDIPEDVRAIMVERTTRAAKARGKPRGHHLTFGHPHPMARAVITPRGRFMSIRLASQAHGISEQIGRRRLRRGAWTLA